LFAPSWPAVTPQIDLAPLHLLAHAQRECGHFAQALECFTAAVALGFDDDWQLAVETAIDASGADSINKPDGVYPTQADAAVLTMSGATKSLKIFAKTG
jgi:hypothetical protein